MQNVQTAEFPVHLEELVRSLSYKPGWSFSLREIHRGQGCYGLTLVATVDTIDAYDQARRKTVEHRFPVPAAAYDARSWRRWLFDQVLLVEQHEACEFFVIDGARPYAPHHAPGCDPYVVTEVGELRGVDTDFAGRPVCPHCANLLPPRA